MAKLDRSITAIPDFPPERALEVKVARIQWLAQRGKLAEARTALEGAQSFAGAAQINAWQRRNLDALKLEAGNAAIPEAAPEPVPNTDQLQRSPFLPISFTHRVVPRDGEAGLVNIRFTASAPARLECYDAVTGRLLAIDANGNGRFTDPGDVLPEDADGNRALDLAFEDTRKIREVEVFVFPTATGISPGKVHVDVDLLTTAGWERSARHELE